MSLDCIRERVYKYAEKAEYSFQAVTDILTSEDEDDKDLNPGEAGYSPKDSQRTGSVMTKGNPMEERGSTSSLTPSRYFSYRRAVVVGAGAALLGLGYLVADPDVTWDMVENVLD